MISLFEKDYYLASVNEEQETTYQPVSLEIIGNAKKGISKPVIVSIDGKRKGYLKNTVEVDDSDDLELVLNYIGSRLGVKMAEEYRVLSKEYEKLGLLSVSVIQNTQDFFSEMRGVQFEIFDLLKNGQIVKTDWISQWLDITTYPAFPEISGNWEYRCKSKEDCLAAIELGLHYVKARYPGNEKAYQTFAEDYFRMILFDILIGQTDRTMDNYGVIFHTRENSYELAPLFDSATLQKPYLAWEQYSLNGMVLERMELCEVLFDNFGEEIRRLAEPMLEIFEKQKHIFIGLAESWIENEGRDILIRRMEQGYQMLRGYCR